MKICKSCLIELPFDAFTPNKVTKDGREGKCRTCRANQRKKCTKNCEHCSVEFYTPKKETVFCSIRCSGKARIKTVEIVCPTCTKTFEINPFKAKAERVFCSKECFVKDMSQSRRGEKNWNYNPNKTLKDRMQERCYPEYYNWRTRVYSRDNYTCVSCKEAKSGSLVAHHIFSYAKNPALRTNINNGVTLCTKCHRDFHSRFGYHNNTEDQFKVFLKSRIR